jgi:hypothetical protein
MGNSDHDRFRSAYAHANQIETDLFARGAATLA